MTHGIGVSLNLFAFTSYQGINRLSLNLGSLLCFYFIPGNKSFVFEFRCITLLLLIVKLYSFCNPRILLFRCIIIYPRVSGQ